MPFLNFIRFVIQKLNAVLTTINDLPRKEPNLPHAQSTAHKRTIKISQYIMFPHTQLQYILNNNMTIFLKF